jgi:hypothetical protein
MCSAGTRFEALSLSPSLEKDARIVKTVRAEVSKPGTA